MSVRTSSIGAVLTMGLVLVAPAVASAERPGTTPGQEGVQGCAAYGKAISGGARGLPPRTFGQTARGGAPIADEIAPFFGSLCSGS